jgi:hypothetical protein
MTLCAVFAVGCATPIGVRYRFEDDPQRALAEMHAGLAPNGDEDRVFALAVLSFVYAQRSGDRSHYLASAVYAYAFLLPGKHGTSPKGIDPRFRWAADIYNQALTRAAMLEDQVHPVPRGGTFKLPFGRSPSNSMRLISSGPITGSRSLPPRQTWRCAA